MFILGTKSVKVGTFFETLYILCVRKQQDYWLIIIIIIIIIIIVRIIQIIQEAPSFTHKANVISERIVKAWNFLPDTVDFSFISGFKRSIHKVDFSRFLTCF